MLYLTGNSENIIYTNVSVNKELSNPTYLMSLTHQQTGKNWTFIPQNITPQSGSPYNSRYDVFKFNLVDENTPEDLTGGTLSWYWTTPPYIVNDNDLRYTGTSQSYLQQRNIVSDLFGTYTWYYDFDNWTEEITGVTMTLNGLPLVVDAINNVGLTNIWLARTTISGGFYNTSGLLSIAAETTEGRTIYDTFYICSLDTIDEKEPWTYYGDNNLDGNRNYPITHLITPNIQVDEIGEFRYSIWEQINPINLNVSTAYNKLEVGLAYITELFSDVFYDDGETSEVYDPDLDYPSPTPSVTITPTVTPTPSVTPTISVTPSLTPSSTPSAPFSPDDISGLTIWYDFDDTSTMTLNGSLIEQVDDLSGNDFHLTANSGSEPTLSTDSTYGGNNTAVFNGSTTELYHYLSSSYVGMTGHSFYYVFKMEEISGGNQQAPYQILEDVGGDEDRFWGTYYESTNRFRTHTDSMEANFEPYTTFTSQYPYILLKGRVYDNGAGGSVIDIEMNDTVPSSTSSGVYDLVNFDKIGVGGRVDAIDNDEMLGNWGEFIFYDRKLTDIEENQVITYLKNKWNYTNW
jgi:hypothetical protein